MKIYILIGALILSSFGGWLVRGWYEGDQVKDAIEFAVNQANKKAKQDLTNALEAQRIETNLRTKFNQVKDNAQKITLCGNSGRDFLGLFNEASKTANTTKTD